MYVLDKEHLDKSKLGNANLENNSADIRLDAPVSIALYSALLDIWDLLIYCMYLFNYFMS